ncbi:acetyl-CoA carboxyl transferase [Nakamurella sp. YIM 132087]|uniref:Acetyl-CoA carboxyl transferase n=1 Tax=Nakamurella alba TaxID=2665158 RepID=A0A7K1FQE0_9ACTN|nr:carboxyl transferase domain-containing protein [Nakamurella alba]MTD16351.1 acetyl-CoA carboxyl transferase [Nakamurella alba]
MSVPTVPPAAARRNRPGARDLLDIVLDADSFTSWDQPVVRPPDLDPAYVADLAAAAQKSGADEAVLTGAGSIRGRRVAVLVSEFRFLAGSIGIAAADRIVSAIRRATAEGLPLLAAPASGGTRMQEGTPAFVQMVRITEAIGAHRSAGLPYLVYLRHPTTGGVFASWGSLGHVTVGEPGALVGFLGPKVYEALYSEPFPTGVQTSENLAEHGLIDAVLPPERLPDIASRALNVLGGRRRGFPHVDAPGEEQQPETDAWTSIEYTRLPQRPGVRELLRFAATDVVPLTGTGQGESDAGLQLVLARFSGVPCVLLGQDRATQIGSTPLGPAALRVARRGMKLAAELELPLVSVIDTPGAALSKDAEEGGLAGEIARCLADLVALQAPAVCVLLGQGSGGGAMALLPADRVIAARHAWLSPLPPEGASAIVHAGDVSHAAEMAAAQGVRAIDLRRRGIVDRIVPEYEHAAQESAAFSRRMGAVLAQEMSVLISRPAGERMARRGSRYAF